MLVEAGDIPIYTHRLLSLRGTKVAHASKVMYRLSSTLNSASHKNDIPICHMQHPDGLGTLCCALLLSQNPCCMQAAVVHHEGSDKPGCTCGSLFRGACKRSTGWIQKDRTWGSRAQQQQHNICRSLPPSQVPGARWCRVAASCLC